MPWLLPTCLEERSSRNPTSPPQKIATPSFVRASPDFMFLICSGPKEPQRLARAGRAHGYSYRLQETKRTRSPSLCLVPSHRNTAGGAQLCIPLNTNVKQPLPKTMRYHLMGALYQKSREQLVVRTWRKWNPCVLLVECKIVQPLWKTVWQFLKNLKIVTPWSSDSPSACLIKRT